MNDVKQTQHVVAAYLKDLPTPDSAEVDNRVLADALAAMHKTKNQRTAPVGRAMWRTIMTSRIGKLAIAAVVVVAVLSLTVFDGLTQPAWAWEDAIEAVRGFQAVHLVGAFPGGAVEVWMRANTTKTQTTDVVARSSHGTITWTQDGSTYHYEPSQNTVYYEHALTIGLAEWLGPGLLEMLSTAENTEVVRGKDPATGRNRVTLWCSLVDVHGPQSWIIEFDAATKLPIAMKQWQNLDRSGPPSFDAFKITYYESLPDSVFAVQVPGQATYVQKPITVSDENIGIMSDAADGMATEGMTQQEAAERILRTVFQAIINGDLATLKRMCPVSRNWGDEFLQSVLVKTGRDERIVEVLEIGQISETGHSKLGPIVALPVSVRRQDGVKTQQKMIVQFRQLGGVSSCVVYGPYGLPQEIE